MAEISFSLSDLFLETFGYRTDAFDPKPNAVKGVKVGGRTEQGAFGSAYYAVDVVGREYYLPVELQVGSENAEALGVTDSSGAVTGRILLPYPVMSVSSRKRIITTDLTERTGSAAELINIGGWNITIKGFLINKGANEFPEGDLAMLVRLYKLNKVVRINNPITDVLLLSGGGSGEKEVYIEDFSLLDARGKKHVRGYEMKLCSNEPFNLIDLS